MNIQKYEWKNEWMNEWINGWMKSEIKLDKEFWIFKSEMDFCTSEEEEEEEEEELTKLKANQSNLKGKA